MSSWSNDDCLSFLEHYQMESCIWNPKDANHKDKKKQADAWIRLAQLTGRPVKEVKNKKEILMTTFRKHLKKKQESIRSGAVDLATIIAVLEGSDDVSADLDQVSMTQEQIESEASKIINDCDAGGQYCLLDLDKHNASSKPMPFCASTDKPNSSCPEKAEAITSCSRDVEPITITRTDYKEEHVAKAVSECRKRAIWKKGKKLGFTDTEGGKKIIGLCAAMAYLPHDHIPEAWLYILHNIPNGATASAFTDYMSNQWIKNSNLITCYGDVYRTTNHVEGWHNRLNRRIAKNPSLYHIIDIFKGEATESDFKIDQLNNHVDENVPKKRRKTDSKDRVITKIIDDFLCEKIEIGICLQRLANVKLICDKK
ncbi:unnamed protein product [Plutella xylostella]|uniref:(diamondback moth) hypothetical protein n=1 Tax=Plutella xylostella TaxID=51655 RepID=A0A8S4FQ43_PLUXY|nr:unnamed protein product [Plutella xylostella]